MRKNKQICPVCKGDGYRWIANKEGKPVKIYCTYCDAKGYYQSMSTDDFERLFNRRLDCE